MALWETIVLGVLSILSEGLATFLFSIYLDSTKWDWTRYVAMGDSIIRLLISLWIIISNSIYINYPPSDKENIISSYKWILGVETTTGIIAPVLYFINMWMWVHSDMVPLFVLVGGFFCALKLAIFFGEMQFAMHDLQGGNVPAHFLHFHKGSSMPNIVNILLPSQYIQLPQINCH